MKKVLFTLTLAAAPLLVAAQALQVENAWIRPTVVGQQGTGGFMLLKSKEGVTITGVSAPSSVGTAELHEMKMDGDVMRMKAIDTLVVPAGHTVALKPGGYHLMLVGLKAPLGNGTHVPVTFRFKDAKGVATQMQVKIAVTSAAPVAPAASAAVQPHGHGH